MAFWSIIINSGSGGGGGGADHAGIASFSSTGSGAGVDYVDVALASAMLADYVITLAVTGALNSSATVGLPHAYVILKTLAGFRIVPQAAFDGRVSWAVFAPTQ